MCACVQVLSWFAVVPSITANAVEGLVKLLRRMTSGGRKVDVGLLEAWYFQS